MLASSSPAKEPGFFPDFRRMTERQKAIDRIRETQQGHGKPIIALKDNGNQIVAVGNTLYFSPTWKTFPDFLCHYIKKTLGEQWGNAELAKPFAERHPIVQWYDELCRQQQASIKTPGVPSAAPVTGVVASYVGLAYSLYLLDHNVELQSRLVHRLKHPDQFQGAYYELIVANILIRAGFELEILDETDRSVKHCEFSARSKRTGKKYWVEAKMRAVVGLLGCTAAKGTTDTNPISSLIPQLNKALAKPAADERLIFIDLNTEATLGVEKPAWIEKAASRLETYEKKELAQGARAYMFITNFPFHRELTSPMSMHGFVFGLGIPDMNRPGMKRVTDAYREKLKHIDAHHIGDALQSFGRFPATFDGTLPSEGLHGKSRILIGNTYCFGDPANGGVIGTVTAGAVNEGDGTMIIGVTDQQGTSSLYQEKLSPEELEEYRNHKDSYFGVISNSGGKIKDDLEMFEWFVETHKGLSREQLLEKYANSPLTEQAKAMSTEDLLYEHCEQMVASLARVKKQSPA